MKENLVIIQKQMLVLLFILIPYFLFGAQQRERDHLILFDVTGSMEGRGDGMGIDIFDDVKAYAKQYVDDVNIGEILAIYPFAGGIRSAPGQYFFRLIESENDKRAAKNFIDNLVADGQRTWLTVSYEQVTDKLKKLEEFIPDYKEKTREQVILLYTDGKGNGPRDNDINHFINRFNLIRTDFDYLFTKFIVIGESIRHYDPEDMDKLEEAEIEVVIAGRQEAIDQIRVSPSSLLFSNHNPVNRIQFSDISADNLGETISIGVRMRDDTKCLIDLKPDTFQLTNTSFNLEAILHYSEEDCFKELFERDAFEGVLNFVRPHRRMDFTTVSFEYQIIRSRLVFTPEHPEEPTINDRGSLKIKVSGNENMKESRIVVVDLEGYGADEQAVEVSPFTFEVNNETEFIELTVRPVDRKAYRSFARSLDEDMSRELLLNFYMGDRSPFVLIDEDYSSFAITHVIQKKMPLWVRYLVIGLIVALILLLLILKAITAKFPASGRIEDDEGRICGYLKPKFGKTHLTLGNSDSDDIKVEGVGVRKSCKIFPHTHDTIQVQKANPSIKILDMDGLEKESILLRTDESFKIQEGEVTKDIYFMN